MRRYVTASDKIDEIRLLVRHPEHRQTIFLILEGKTDIRLFRKIYSNDIVQIEEVDGKGKVLEVIMNLNSYGFDGRILGLCDADFDHILNTVPESDNVFVTDYHDIEVMMLFSESFEGLISEVHKDSAALQLLRQSLLDDVLIAGREIGVLRLINKIQNLNINFKGCNFDDFCNIRSTKIVLNIDDLIDELIRRSKHLKEGFGFAEIKELYTYHSSMAYCNLQICCGHDLTKLVSYILKQRSISCETNIGHERIEEYLRVGYNYNLFVNTTMGKNINAWQTSKGISLY